MKYAFLFSLLFSVLGIGTCVAFFLVFIKFSHEDLSLLLVNYYQLADKLFVLQRDYFTAEAYYLLRFIFFGGAFVWTWLAYCCFTYKFDILGKIFRALSVLFSPIADGWRTLSHSQKSIAVAFFALMLVVQIGLALAFPPHTDEMFSYHFLVKRGLGVVLAYYPGPNNHVGYLWLPSLLQNALPPLMAMRLPALLYATLHSLFLFALLKKHVPFLYSLMALCLVNCSVFVLFYSVHGRGYILLVLCTLVLCHLSEHLSGKIHQWLWVGISAWGFFTVPVFIFIWAALVCMLYLAYRKSKKAQICLTKLIVRTMALVLLLYFPILFFNGYQALIFNSWVVSDAVSWSSVLRYLWHWDILFDVALPTLPLTFLTSFALVIYEYASHKPKCWRFYIGVLTFLSCLFPVLYVLFMGSTPPLRIFTTLSVVCILFWLAVYFQILQRLRLHNKRWIATISGVGTLAFCIYFINFQYQNRYGIRQEYYYAEEVCHFLEKQRVYSLGTDSYLIYIKMQYSHGAEADFNIQFLPSPSHSASANILVLRKPRDLIKANQEEVLFENSLFKVVIHLP